MQYQELIQKLGQYVSVLGESYRVTHYADSRPAYLRHLSFAAELLGALYLKKDHKTLATMVDSENRNYGWEFLPGEEGTRATQAWVDFKKYFESIESAD